MKSAEMLAKRGESCVSIIRLLFLSLMQYAFYLCTLVYLCNKNNSNIC